MGVKVLNTYEIKENAELLYNEKSYYYSKKSVFTRFSFGANEGALSNYLLKINQIYTDIASNIEKIGDFLKDYIEDIESLENLMSGRSGFIKASNVASIVSNNKNIIRKSLIDEANLFDVVSYTTSANMGSNGVNYDEVNPIYRRIATAGISVLAFLEGAGNVVEMMVDGMGTLASGACTIFGSKKISEDIMGFVKQDISGDIYHNVVSVTGLDKYGNPDGAVAGGARVLGNLGGMIGLTALTGGLASGVSGAFVSGGVISSQTGSILTAGATIGINTFNNALIDSGSEGELAMQKGASVTESLSASLSGAVIGGITGAVSGGLSNKLNILARSGVGVGSLIRYGVSSALVTTSTPVLNELSRTIIYQNDKNLSFLDNFMKNSQTDGLLAQMAFAGAFGLANNARSAISGLKFFNKLSKQVEIGNQMISRGERPILEISNIDELTPKLLDQMSDPASFLIKIDNEKFTVNEILLFQKQRVEGGRRLPNMTSLSDDKKEIEISQSNKSLFNYEQSNLESNNWTNKSKVDSELKIPKIDDVRVESRMFGSMHQISDLNDYLDETVSESHIQRQSDLSRTLEDTADLSFIRDLNTRELEIKLEEMNQLLANAELRELDIMYSRNKLVHIPEHLRHDFERLKILKIELTYGAGTLSSDEILILNERLINSFSDQLTASNSINGQLFSDTEIQVKKVRLSEIYERDIVVYDYVVNGKTQDFVINEETALLISRARSLINEIETGYGSLSVEDENLVKKILNNSRAGKLLRQEVLASAENISDPILKARKLYVELSKKLHYSTEYIRKGNNRAYYDKITGSGSEMTFERLNESHTVVCKGWSELYYDLLIRSGFDQDKVHIVGSKHKWIQIDLDQDRILIADATETILGTTDLSCVKSGLATNGFMVLDKKFSRGRISNMIKSGVFSPEYLDSCKSWIMDIDSFLGYASGDGFLQDHINKAKSLFYDPDLTSRVLGYNPEIALIEDIVKLDIPKGMDGLEVYAYYKKIFSKSSLGSQVKMEYIITPKTYESIFSLTYKNFENETMHMIFGESFGKMVLRHQDYLNKLALLGVNV